MDQDTLFELYTLERDYQRKVFGDYKSNDSLNLASFIVFIETYLKRAKESYAESWTQNLPGWLEDCMENSQGTAPVKTYEFIIKIMALAGAALETYAEINPNEWRKENSVKDKWRGDK
jgi:hypothetical protein